MDLNIMIVGVGGQGTLLTSKILGAAFMMDGHDVKVSEVHGMAQRGGSVVTYVKCSEKVHSPVIGKGEADLILAFEQLEAARWLPFLKPGGRILISTQQIDPMPVITGAEAYPENIIDKIDVSEKNIVAVDAPELAEKAGSSKAINVVMIGAMVRFMGLSKYQFEDALTETVPEKYLKMNQTAFNLGYNAIMSTGEKDFQKIILKVRSKKPHRGNS